MLDEVPVLLLHSPLVGPSTWCPVARQLRARGHDVTVEDPRDVERGGPALVVAHSNAGLYAPDVAERLRAVTTVYVDAALPDPGPTTALAPDGLRAHLAGLADAEGVLPPWHRWWPEDVVGPLFPDARTRAVVEAEVPRVPLSYVHGRLPVPPGWTTRPGAYLAFGDTYADERARAAGWGWPVASLDGAHLHQLHDPVLVAEKVVALAAASLLTGRGSQ